MSTTSITSGTDFIGKTLIIGSTGSENRTYSRILDFNNNSTNAYIYAMYQFNNQQPWVGFKPIGGGESAVTYNYSAQTNIYYIYALSFISTTEIKYNIYEYNILASTITSKGTITTFTTPNTFLSSLTHFWLGRSAYNRDFFYNGYFSKVTLYNGNLFALSDANILSTLLTVVTSTQTNIINDSTTYTFRSLGTNFLGVVVNIINYNTTTGYTVTNSNITLLGSGTSTTIGGYLNIIGSYIEPVPHNLNTPNKQWLMYLNTLSSISGDDLTIKPDNARNLLLEVSANNNIFMKKGTTLYNLTNLITGDVSFSNIDVSQNLNPLLPNNSSLGLPNKVWGNAYIKDISLINMSISGSFSNVRQIIPQITNDISTSLGNLSNMWQKAFIRDLSGITSINGSNWPITGPTGPTGPTGATGPIGPELRVNINRRLTDINNFRLTTKSRIYQNISGSFNDPIWNAVNGYYGLAKDAYPSLNPLSSGVKAVQTWTIIPFSNSSLQWSTNCWSPELGIFVCISSFVHPHSIAISNNGINWSTIVNPLYSSSNAVQWESICWSPQLKIFVACGIGGPLGPRFMRSEDGIIWIDSTFTETVYQDWNSICWSPELGIFVAVGGGYGNTNTSANVAISTNGVNWQQIFFASTIELLNVCWSPELKLFVAVGIGIILRSSNGTIWINDQKYLLSRRYARICWSPQLGIFLVGDHSQYNPFHTSSDGINWTNRIVPSSVLTNYPTSICWSPQLRIFFIACNSYFQIISNDGITFQDIFISNMTESSYTNPSCVSWSPELGIFCAATYYGGVVISSLKGRPPTSYNVFDSSFNRIDENGNWTFQTMAVTTMTAGGSSVTSDDRLKHNEVIITNGLDVIDKLTPKFYQKTQVLLDAGYNGDLTAYTWSLESGLIAQEVLQINDLSYVVGGGDYYEPKYIYKRQANDLSYNYYETSGNYFELSNNYFEPRANNYEISYNLITQAYNLNYNSVFVYGVAAIKELHTKVKAQETTILDEQLNDLVTRIEALEHNISS